MADDSELTITPREAGSLSNAVALFHKVARILTDIDSKFHDLDFPWWGGPIKVQMGLTYYLRTSGRLVISHSGKMPGAIEYGLVDERNGDPDWVFIVRNQSGEAFAESVRRAALDGMTPLEADWTRTLGSNVVLQRTVRFVDCHEHAAAAQWLNDCIRQLDQAGVLSLLKPKGKVPTEPESATLA